jgi:ribosome-binding factor A
MAKEYPRHERIGEQIQRDLSELIRKEIKDPRMSPIVTVAEVKVSADLGRASVYVTVLDDKGKASVDVLNRASGFLRGLLGQRLRLRTIPHLHFIYDTTAERGARLSALIDKAVAADRGATGDDDAAGDEQENR